MLSDLRHASFNQNGITDNLVSNFIGIKRLIQLRFNFLKVHVQFVIGQFHCFF